MRKNTRERFVDMNRLYHFTNFSSACKIIKSKKLRFGKMFRMNDLIESNRIVFDRLVLDNLEEESIWSGFHYLEIKDLDRKLPVLSYEYGLDGFMQWREVPDDPIGAEHIGFW